MIGDKLCSAPERIDVPALIDAQGLGIRQSVAIFGCSLVAVFDGLDVQALGLAAPAMMTYFQIAPPLFGMVFSATLLGLALGAFGLGVIADRFGRKGVLVGATLCFGVFTLLTAFAAGLPDLLFYRFMAGLGLGGAMPAFISLACEFVPTRKRPVIAGIIWAGFPVGGMVGGLLGAFVIPAHGWQSIFLIGGVLPILLSVPLGLLLPESVSYLLLAGASDSRITNALKRILAPGMVPRGALYARPVVGPETVPVGRLFSEGRALKTAMLWLSFICVFPVLLGLNTWEPVLLQLNGVNVEGAALAMAAFNGGSVISSASAGLLVARVGVAAVLPMSMLGAACTLVIVGHGAPAFMPLVVAQGLIGLLLGCASSGVIAVAAATYPTAIRSTGVGWAMGLGRLFSIGAPLVVAALVGAHAALSLVFTALAAPLLLGAGSMLALGLSGRRKLRNGACDIDGARRA